MMPYGKNRFPFGVKPRSMLIHCRRIAARQQNPHCVKLVTGESPCNSYSLAAGGCVPIRVIEGVE
jgi:hypothetical protein